MSRLIDADALKQECMHIDDIPAVTERDIDAAPTIDAIPTDWLRGKMKEYESREFDEPGMYFRFVLWAWQKEQDEGGIANERERRV